MTYRYTRDARFLDTAVRLADYYVDRLPSDSVPYWDFQAPNIPNEPRDTSDAAIAAAGLLELSRYAATSAQQIKYFQTAEKTLKSLSSSAYLANGAQSDGILLHGVGNKPAGGEINVSLIYGDYYFVEALLRYKQELESRSGFSPDSGRSTY